LRPTPAKFHYLFNLRDVSKVFQGILMSKPISIQNPETMAKLWVNESQRVFYDRLINNEDKLWFTKLIIELLNRCFRINIEHDTIFVKEKIMFGDILKLDAPIKLYEEIRDKNKMHKVLNGMLDDYNMSNSNKMNLVFFEDAIEHILRISRSLKQPRGNIMLIGVGGSGKQSLTKLASHMREILFKQIEITRNFGPAQFKDFMKELMFTTGIDGKPICFLMTDTQIISETFIEDINNLLNTGEIPNLWLPEDKDKIINGVRPVVVEMKKVDTIETINQTFINRIRDNLHICLCMSPVGDTLRVRCRMFPSLVNCCTLDWFSRWPEEALLYVSSEFLKELELPSDDVRQALSEMCMRIHTSVEDTSDRFFGELRRRVYTTPKSYLDLINLYLNTLDVKRSEYNVNRNRLAIGLKKLNDTNKSIAELKIKLTELLPQIAQKNEELKVALVKVNADKAVANEKERVVSGEAEVVNKKASEAKAISDDAEADLAAAKPELEAAESALKALDKASIVEIKSFAKPSENVVMVMEACMILIGEKTDWNSVKSVLGNPGEFMQRLMTYDVSKTSEKILEKVRKQYLSRPEFDPKIIEKASVAAKVICIWCGAVSKFQIVIKKVEPKKKKYEEVQSILATAQAELAQKMAEVNKVKDAVAKLEAECLAMQNEKERLEFEQDRCNKRMGRAEKLVVLLADEGVRWKETVENLGVEIEQLVGNVFLSCACISYTGAFTGVYRIQMVSKWVEQCLEKEIPTS
jgi:dynein heavy chain, axonemal